ncbi:hypothetical protein COU57_04890 [Candidatus Pacearchaeota archaeon CG10_big_fil_rev_8_21_14_0_10_32_14]|nr:MAG: hypothetical protein COU57_04890 [Candidatus Pacearchaeota archaeon CG10_big_fil_rev_8_21_14_0_10_32_14]
MINPQDYPILLAEDDSHLRKKFVSLLKNRGFRRIIQACDGSELYKAEINLRGIQNLVIVSDTLMENEKEWKIRDNLPEHLLTYRAGWKTQESVRVKTYKMLGHMINYLLIGGENEK